MWGGTLSASPSPSPSTSLAPLHSQNRDTTQRYSPLPTHPRPPTASWRRVCPTFLPLSHRTPKVCGRCHGDTGRTRGQRSRALPVIHCREYTSTPPTSLTHLSFTFFPLSDSVSLTSPCLFNQPPVSRLGENMCLLYSPRRTPPSSGLSLGHRCSFPRSTRPLSTWCWWAFIRIRCATECHVVIFSRESGWLQEMVVETGRSGEAVGWRKGERKRRKTSKTVQILNSAGLQYSFLVPQKAKIPHRQLGGYEW